jgi:serine/threonine-protein kinase ULK/ATG1
VKTPAVSKKLKKRIGPFSFYLSDIIGQGYSSFVYKGIKDNDKQQVVAIKVIDI